MTKKIFVGVDLGGTKILANPLVLGKEIKILGKSKTPTRVDEGVDVIVNDIVKTIHKSLDNAGVHIKSVSAIGIGVPGAVDVKDGCILMAVNLGWQNVKIKKLLEKKIKIPVFVDNDVNLGVLGEQQYGAGRGANDVVGVFWGTGIGGGLVLNGKIHHGHSFTAGEIGHLVVDRNGEKCSCGNQGCLEAEAGKWAISRDWEMQENTNSYQKPGILKSKAIRKQYRASDPFFINALNTACEYIGMSLSSIVNLLNPQVIIAGGGMIESMGEELMEKIDEVMREHIFPQTEVKLVQAELGDFAVITGAAVLASQKAV